MLSTLIISNLGGKDLFQVIGYSPSPKETKAGTQGRRVKQKSQWNTAFWLTPRLLLSYLPYTAQYHMPRTSSIHSGLGPLHHLGIKKMPLRCVHKQFWLRPFFNWSSFFLGWSSCQPRIPIRGDKLKISKPFNIRQRAVFRRDYKTFLKTREKDAL